MRRKARATNGSPQVGGYLYETKLRALARVAQWQPAFTLGLFAFGGAVAFLQGVGLTFIYPIIEVVQTDGAVEAQDTVMEIFLTTYELLNIPFTLGYLMIGVAAVMTLRFSSAFMVQWFDGHPPIPVRRVHADPRV